MKANTTFIFAGIMSAVIGNAYATGENTVTSKSYVDAELSTKQDIISPTNYSASIGNSTYPVKGLVLFPDGNTSDVAGVIGTNKLFSADMAEALGDWAGSNPYNDATGGYFYNAYLGAFSFGETCTGKICNNFVPGFKDYVITGAALYEGLNRLRMFTEDMIYDATTGTANTIANYDENGELGNGIATYDGSGTYNAATDAGKIATAAAVETKQDKMTCAGWPESVPVNQRTDANCWLWNKN